MKVLVTGAAGFIGAQVVRQLRSRGDEVIALVRPGSPRPRLRDVADLRCAELVLEDGSALDRLLASTRPQAIIHLAWYANPSDYLDSSRNLESLHATVRLAERAFVHGCLKFVGVGTCLEYASSDRPVAESDPADPRSLYAAAKHAAWLVTRALGARSGAETAWARVFHLYGPGEDSSRLVPSVTAALRRGVPADVTAGEQTRDYMHVADAAAGIVTLARPGVAGVVNVCSGEARTLRQVLETLGRLVGKADLVRFGARPYAAGETMYLAGSADRLRSLGWAPCFPTLEAGLRDTLEPHLCP